VNAKKRYEVTCIECGQKRGINCPPDSPRCPKRCKECAHALNKARFTNFVSKQPGSAFRTPRDP